MAEQAQNRVQQAIKGFVGDVDQTHLRPMEKNMHLCAAECCGQTSSTIEAVHRYLLTYLGFGEIVTKIRGLNSSVMLYKQFNSFNYLVQVR